jgi:hypothetical protein
VCPRGTTLLGRRDDGPLGLPAAPAAPVRLAARVTAGNPERATQAIAVHPSAWEGTPAAGHRTGLAVIGPISLAAPLCHGPVSVTACALCAIGVHYSYPLAALSSPVTEPC